MGINILPNSSMESGFSVLAILDAPHRNEAVMILPINIADAKSIMSKFAS